MSEELEECEEEMLSLDADLVTVTKSGSSNLFEPPQLASACRNLYSTEIGRASCRERV